jgi:hypothetical protein
MKSKEALNGLHVTGLLCFFFMLVFVGQTMFSPPQIFASDAICAQVLETKGAVESKTPGEKSRSLEPGMSVMIGEELGLGPESWIVLMMADSTVRKFSGPATMVMKENVGESGGSVLTRLGSAIAGLLFAEEEGSEVVMVTREPGKDELFQTATSHFPLLVHPSPGSRLLEKPAKLEWVNVDGIPLYRVSVYSWESLLWQGTTSHSTIECPPEKCKFEPGEEYYWVVEGLIGNSTVRSAPAKFKILSEKAGQELSAALSAPDLSVFSRARLCLSLNLYHAALELVNSHLQQAPSDAEAYRLRAEILGTMGLFRDAFFDYYEAAYKSSGK